jgi:hypothetical protein
VGTAPKTTQPDRKARATPHFRFQMSAKSKEQSSKEQTRQPENKKIFDIDIGYRGPKRGSDPNQQAISHAKRATHREVLTAGRCSLGIAVASCECECTRHSGFASASKGPPKKKEGEKKVSNKPKTKPGEKRPTSLFFLGAPRGLASAVDMPPHMGGHLQLAVTSSFTS